MMLKKTVYLSLRDLQIGVLKAAIAKHKNVRKDEDFDLGAFIFSNISYREIATRWQDVCLESFLKKNPSVDVIFFTPDQEELERVMCLYAGKTEEEIEGEVEETADEEELVNQE